MLRIAVFFLPLLTFAQEHATEAAPSAEPNIIYKWINFGILAVAIAYLVSKYLVPALKARSSSISEDLVNSKNSVQAAEARVADLNLRLTKFDSEVKGLRERSIAEREIEAKRVSEQTQGLLTKLAQARETEIGNATQVAQQQLRTFAAQGALALAQARLAGQNEAAQTALVQGFISDLQKVEAA